MSAQTPGSLDYDEPSRIELWIEQHTAGRVHHLRVEIIEDRLIVHGSAGSHYVRQLALAAALEVNEVAGGRTRAVEMDIGVRTERLHLK